MCVKYSRPSLLVIKYTLSHLTSLKIWNSILHVGKRLKLLVNSTNEYFRYIRFAVFNRCKIIIFQWLSTEISLTRFSNFIHGFPLPSFVFGPQIPPPSSIFLAPCRHTLRPISGQLSKLSNNFSFSSVLRVLSFVLSSHPPIRELLAVISADLSRVPAIRCNIHGRYSPLTAPHKTNGKIGGDLSTLED